MPVTSSIGSLQKLPRELLDMIFCYATRSMSEEDLIKLHYCLKNSQTSQLMQLMLNERALACRLGYGIAIDIDLSHDPKALDIAFRSSATRLALTHNGVVSITPRAVRLSIQEQRHHIKTVADKSGGIASREKIHKILHVRPNEHRIRTALTMLKHLVDKVSKGGDQVTGSLIMHGPPRCALGCHALKYDRQLKALGGLITIVE